MDWMVTHGLSVDGTWKARYGGETVVKAWIP